MTDPAKAHPEMRLKCGECGHTWQASSVRWCLGCGGREIYEQQPAPAPSPVLPGERA